MFSYETSLSISSNRHNSMFGAGHAAGSAGDLARAKYCYPLLLEIIGIMLQEFLMEHIQ